MKTADVLRKIKKAAKAAGLEYETYELRNHTGIRVGIVSTTIGRHRETPDLFAETIYKQLEEALGKDWWR